MCESPKDWKLKLRYGNLTTDFTHFTVVADGVVGNLLTDYECRPGRAFMAMKTWALDCSQSAEMIQVIGQQIGFTVDGEVQIFETDPEQPPRENPYGYGIAFTPYDDET